MDVKKVYIIHRWGGNSKEGWLAWLGEQFQDKGYEVNIPDMPDTEEPRIEEWVGFLRTLAPNPDEHTYFIGHSIGCQTIIRYLEKLDNVKIGGAVFVAGWFTLTGLESPEEREIAQPWIETPIDFGRARKATSRFTVILSTNDPYVPLAETRKMFEDNLSAHIIIEKNKGHFTEDDNVSEMPELVNLIG